MPVYISNPPSKHPFSPGYCHVTANSNIKVDNANLFYVVPVSRDGFMKYDENPLFPI